VKASVFIATSLDGFIARPDGAFGSLSRDIRLEHVSTRTYSCGLVQSEYTLAGGQ